MKVTVLGAGYVGLVTAACLAEKGHTVRCVDVAAERVEMVNKGQTPFHEEGLQSILCTNVKAGRLYATCSLEEAHRGTEMTFVTVGTPTVRNDVDFSALDRSVSELGSLLRHDDIYHTVIIKSTVPPTTTDTRVRTILERESGKTAGQFGLVMNPEFLREGHAIRDFLHPDRIVIGAFDDRSFYHVRELYAFTTAPILRTNPRAAEMIKYATNSLLGTMISFSNELAGICEAIPDVDIVEVMQGLHLDRRLNVNQSNGNAEIVSYLKAGCGFGGSCLPKDIAAIVAFGRKLGLEMEILRAALSVNSRRPRYLADLAESALGSLRGKTVAVLGMAFKPNTDDVRESPAIDVINTLLARGAEVRAHDPIAAVSLPNQLLFRHAHSVDQALMDADAAVVVTPWPEYVSIAAGQFKALMRTPVLIDARRVFSKAVMIEAGIKYYGVGLRHTIISSLANPDKLH